MPTIILTRRSARPFALAMLSACAAMVVVFAAFYTRLPTTGVMTIAILCAAAVVSQARHWLVPQTELLVTEKYLIWRDGRAQPPAEGKIAIAEIESIIETTLRDGEFSTVTLDVLTRDNRLHTIPADCTPDFPDQLHATLDLHNEKITRYELTRYAKS